MDNEVIIACEILSFGYPNNAFYMPNYHPPNNDKVKKPTF